MYWRCTYDAQVSSNYYSCSIEGRWATSKQITRPRRLPTARLGYLLPGLPATCYLGIVCRGGPVQQEAAAAAEAAARLAYDAGELEEL